MEFGGENHGKLRNLEEPAGGGRERPGGTNRGNIFPVAFKIEYEPF